MSAGQDLHPRHDLDLLLLLLHGVRFSLVTVVLSAEKIAFAFLRDALQVND